MGSDTTTRAPELRPFAAVLLEVNKGVVADEAATMRLRYRIRPDKTLVLGYFMNEPKRVVREAVAEVVGMVAEKCDVTVMYGQPA